MRQLPSGTLAAKDQDLDSALAVHRLHFAFTVTYHYLFSQLTMGLALLIVILKTIALQTANQHYNEAARFWAKIFAINFAFGVVTGIPMEFQFGTNWARFSRLAGGVIGQTLAMEGVVSFFPGIFVSRIVHYGEKRLNPLMHWLSAFLAFLGSWMSGFFIIATDAWMQYPVGYKIGHQDNIMLESFWELILNPWTLWPYLQQHDRRCGDRQFCHGVGGRLLFACRALRTTPGIFVRTGVIAGARHSSDGLPDRRWTRARDRGAPAGDAGRAGKGSSTLKQARRSQLLDSPTPTSCNWTIRSSCQAC
jgi:cytochrome d ubiquinol oxidase subunit I